MGGGVSGLVLAWELSRQGIGVEVLEASSQLGGCVASRNLGGVNVDCGAESFATRGAIVEKFLERLNPGLQVVRPRAQAWVYMSQPSPSGELAVPLPPAGLLGIPTQPLRSEVRRAVGYRGAFRAYWDRVFPLLKVDDCLGPLVRRRLGARVLDQLVAPVCQGVYSTDPNDLLTSRAHPDLVAALKRHGSVCRAVAELRGAAPAGSGVLGLSGGMFSLVDELYAQITVLGARVHLDARVVGIELDPLPVFAPTDLDVDELSKPGYRWRIHTQSGQFFDTNYLCLALPRSASLELLSDIPGLKTLADQTEAFSSRLDLALLLLRDSNLDNFPRGSGILVAQKTKLLAKALTHSTAKWEFLAKDYGPGRHLIRLSYGRGQVCLSAGLSDSEFLRLALTEAGELLGRRLSLDSVEDFVRVGWDNFLARTQNGRRVEDFMRAAEKLPGLRLTGGLLGGVGLATVIGKTETLAREVVGEVLRA